MNPDAHRLRPARTHFLVAAVMACLMLIPIGSAPLALGWLLIVPLGLAWWAARAETRVDDSGITARYAFRPQRHMDWDELAGIGFTGSRALARGHDGDSFPLPALSFNDMPWLAKASGGRVPDVAPASNDSTSSSKEPQ